MTAGQVGFKSELFAEHRRDGRPVGRRRLHNFIAAVLRKKVRIG